MQQASQPESRQPASDGTESAAPGSAASGTIVAIEQGRQTRERRGGTKPPRLEKSERRAIRRASRTDEQAGSPGTVEAEEQSPRIASEHADADAPAASPDAPAEMAVAAVDAPQQESPATDAGSSTDAPALRADTAESAQGATSSALAVPAPSPVAARTLLVSPLVDSGAAPKAIERTRVQYQAAEDAVSSNPDVISVIAPLVRHVNSVTEQLNDAQINLGRIMAERDALRMRLAEVEGVDPSELSIMPVSNGDESSRQQLRLQRTEARATDDEESKLQRIAARNPLRVDSAATKEEIARVAKRRQLLAAAIFGAIGLGLYISSRQGNDVSSVSRDSLADLQFVGIFFNMFFMMWMMYRVVRVGGKGAKWLFPSNSSGRGRS
jgi:hypothetical protein